uniref:Uncharacterized protein n=1 Tax=Rhizophora mucronata TaxID=61149 RepID=A0A2P2MRQ5_RHIMU
MRIDISHNVLWASHKTETKTVRRK